MVYCGVLWYTVIYCGILWCTVVYCGILWYTVMYCGILWYTVVYCGVLWYTVGSSHGIVMLVQVSKAITVATPDVTTEELDTTGTRELIQPQLGAI